MNLFKSLLRFKLLSHKLIIFIDLFGKFFRHCRYLFVILEPYLIVISPKLCKCFLHFKLHFFENLRNNFNCIFHIKDIEISGELFKCLTIFTCDSIKDRRRFFLCLFFCLFNLRLVLDRVFLEWRIFATEKWSLIQIFVFFSVFLYYFFAM